MLSKAIVAGDLSLYRLHFDPVFLYTTVVRSILNTGVLAIPIISLLSSIPPWWLSMLLLLLMVVLLLLMLLLWKLAVSTAGQTIDWLVPSIVGCNDEVGIVGDVGIGGI